MTFEIFWTPIALKHLKYWQKHDAKKVVKIKALCRNISILPKAGLGKPERLKFQQANIWSRRIDQEHRLVYEIKTNNSIYILQCRYHYIEE